MDQYREFYLRWIPNGEVQLSISDAVSEAIGPIKKLKIKAITLPLTFYTINNSNKSFELYFARAPYNTFNISLTEGNYTSTEFADLLSVAINAVSPSPVVFAVDTTFNTST